MIWARSASTLYPRFRPYDGCEFERAKKMSRIQVEKLVRDPQNPVAIPMYSGMTFFSVPQCNADSTEVVVAKKCFSSAMKPITTQPEKFAHTTPDKGDPV